MHKWFKNSGNTCQMEIMTFVLYRTHINRDMGDCGLQCKPANEVLGQYAVVTARGRLALIPYSPANNHAW